MINSYQGVAQSSRCATDAPPGAPVACADRLREHRRFSWRARDGGDPAELVTQFLSDNGLPVRDLRGAAGAPHPYGELRVCGAALYVSAAAGAYLVGAPPGRPSPVPAVPDVVAVVYTHGPRHAETPVPRPRRGGLALRDRRAGWTPARHAAAVAQARAAIARGDVYQVNLVGHERAHYSGDPRPALRRVATLPGARYGGILTGPGWALATASPETLVEVRGGRVLTRPIKGTRPATAAGRAALLGSAKERAEHVMIVDLERNDLAHLPGTGPVTVDELYAVRRWCDLWQAESVVSAPLTDAVDLASLLRSVCPGGSVTGAPKRAALEQIARLEPVGRGVSMGALGWVGTDHVDLGLSIRTVAVDATSVHVWAGGGITWGSDPAEEVAEAAAKAAPLWASLGAST
jgi:para-aminobenzoate synthetase component 1